MRLNSRKLFYQSLLASLCLHLITLLCVQRHSLWLRSSPPAGEKQWIASMEKPEKDAILKQTFAFTTNPVAPSKEAVTALPMCTAALSHPTLNAPPFPSPLPPPLLSSEEAISFSLPSQPPLSLFEHLPKDLLQPAPPSAPPLPLLPPPFLATTPPHSSLPPQNLSFPLPPMDRPPAPSIAFRALPAPNTPLAFPPSMPQLPTLEELHTSSYSEEFEAELLFLPQEDGYLFALTLIPRSDLELPPLRQHVSFLIDRSNSIQQERLHIEKNAIKRALEELNPEDTFNIIAFDSKLEKLSPTPLPISKQTLAQAKTFLDNLQLGSFFSPADLYHPLFLTVPAIAEDTRVHTAILLTDGETLGKKSSQHILLSDWTGYNQERVCLFGLSLTHDPHLGTLDALCAFNRGRLLSSPTKRGIKRKLMKLIKTLQNPIANQIRCTAISRSPASAITLFAPASSRLYLNEPFVILGKTDSLDDFVLFVQGHLNNRWLNIKKTISFLNAKKGGASLKAQWALQQAYQLYRQHLIDHNPRHLADAQDLLEPYDLHIAFQ